MQVDYDSINSYRASIPKFMDWARERIAKEVADNEKIVNKYGTADMSCKGIKINKTNGKRNK